MRYHTSDTHFCHNNIIRFERTQFETIEEHDDYIMSVISKTVTKNDELWHHGDVGKMSDKVIEFFQNLPCKTVLIMGNHDKQITKCRQAFDEVYIHPVYIHKRILLSHEPHPVPPGVINIHGHLHNSKLDSDQHHNISIHVFDYKLMSEKDMERLVASHPKEKEKFLYEWYAPLYVFDDSINDVMMKDGRIDLVESRKRLKKP